MAANPHPHAPNGETVHVITEAEGAEVLALLDTLGPLLDEDGDR